MKKIIKGALLIALGSIIGVSVQTEAQSGVVEFDHFQVYTEEDGSYTIEIYEYTNYDVTDYGNGYIGIVAEIN